MVPKLSDFYSKVLIPKSLIVEFWGVTWLLNFQGTFFLVTYFFCSNLVAQLSVLFNCVMMSASVSKINGLLIVANRRYDAVHCHVGQSIILLICIFKFFGSQEYHNGIVFTLSGFWVSMGKNCSMTGLIALLISSSDA